MATRRYSMSAGGQGPKDVTEAVGAAVVSGSVEVTIDFGNANFSGAEGKSRAILKLQEIENYIAMNKWPPA